MTISTQYVPTCDIAIKVAARLIQTHTPFRYVNGPTDNYGFRVYTNHAAYLSGIISGLLPPGGTLTEDMHDEYVASGGSYCPYCKSEDINVSFEQRDIDMYADGSIRVPVVCNGCKRKWADELRLSRAWPRRSNSAEQEVEGGADCRGQETVELPEEENDLT